MKRLLPVTLALSLAFFATACDESNGPYDEAGVYAETFTFDLDDATQEGNFISAEYEVPAITRNVVDNGAVLLYFREFGTWTAMPYTYGVESAQDTLVDFTVTFGFGYDDRTLEVFYETSADPNAVELADDVPMKVVVLNALPAGKTGPDLRDYEAVKAYYGLKD